MSILDEKKDIIIKACRDKLGQDLNLIKIDEITTIADYLIIVSGSSSLQTKAIAREVKNKLEENNFDIYKKEGFNEGNWIILDLGDIILHIFHKDTREYYDLDRLWDISN